MRAETNKKLRHDRISLRYVSFMDKPPERYLDEAALYELDDEAPLDVWRAPESCDLRLRLELNRSTIWNACEIKALIEIALQQPVDAAKIGKQTQNEDNMTDYWPFICPACGIPECAGVFQPVRALQCGKDLILGIPHPLGQVPPEQVTFRKYRLLRRDFLDAVIGVVKFRLAFENMMFRSTGRHDEVEFTPEDALWLTDVFGLHDCKDYQLRISRWVRDNYPRLLECRLSLMDGGRN